jgi:hypothetical protein
MSDTASATEGSVSKLKVSPEFINNVKKYVKVDNELREYREKIKQLNAEKKDKEEFILTYFQTIDTDAIEVQDGILKRNIKKSYGPLKKEFIHKALTEAIGGDGVKAQMLTDHIINTRPITEKITLKRIKVKEEIA